MWINKSKYEIEKLKAKQRIEYLENLLCPGESHDYKLINFYLEGGTGHGDENTIYHYRCSKCGKLISKNTNLSKSDRIPLPLKKV